MRTTIMLGARLRPGTEPGVVSLIGDQWKIQAFCLPLVGVCLGLAYLSSDGKTAGLLGSAIFGSLAMVSFAFRHRIEFDRTHERAVGMTSIFSYLEKQKFVIDLRDLSEISLRRTDCYYANADGGHTVF